MSAPTAASPPASHETQIKETLTSIIIAFILAFVFRAFVVEAFIIPTGSMAPTLMGAHERITSPQTGYTWPVGPWFGPSDNPLPIQESNGRPIRVHDPMMGPSESEIVRFGERRRAGDRILVFKYLFGVYDPTRFDVVVFKAPHVPSAAVNYIKRLVGLPGEEIALVDGDVFVRRPAPGEALAPGQSWGLGDWKIQRKDERVQRAVWQPVYSSEYEPLNPPPLFQSPWEGGTGWTIRGERDYRYSGAGPTTLTWSTARWPIVDFYPYNETSDINGGSDNPRQMLIYAVKDLDLAAGVEPVNAGIDASAVIRARGFEFRADIVGRSVTLKMGELQGTQQDGAPTQWRTLGTGELRRPLAPGRVTNLEFWHADQALSLYADGDLIAHGEYDWLPRERIQHALGMQLDAVVDADQKRLGAHSLSQPQNYPQASLVRWEFTGGPVVLHRVGLQRDIHYQSPGHGPQRARATHPLARMILGDGQYFVCGDNSPSSLDARLWGSPDPWVAATIDATPGIVPRNLMIGRAFFVYFPSLIRGQGWGPVPMPDFGRMRFIW